MRRNQRVKGYVLIESDWNLKWKNARADNIRITVLIESDWNLKY